LPVAHQFIVAHSIAPTTTAQPLPEPLPFHAVIPAKAQSALPDEPLAEATISVSGVAESGVSKAFNQAHK
jgi:hypothetical protein